MQLGLGQGAQASEVHPLMISGSALHRGLTAIVIGLVVGMGLGLRSADPKQADPAAAAARAQRLASAAGIADGALSDLTTVLVDALERARRGAALSVAGESPPAPELVGAADRLVAGAGTADVARRALLVVAGTAAAVAPDRLAVSLSYTGADLLVVAAQLRAGAEAATAFVERRHATEAIVRSLGEAAAALDGDDPAAALRALDTASEPLALIDAWHDRPPLLGYWMTIVGDLLDAARGIATATIDGDAEAVAAAAARYAKAAQTARGADNALALSLSEEGSAVSGTALRRLAVAAGEAADAGVGLQQFLHPAS